MNEPYIDSSSKLQCSAKIYDYRATNPHNSIRTSNHFDDGIIPPPIPSKKDRNRNTQAGITITTGSFKPPIPQIIQTHKLQNLYQIDSQISLNQPFTKSNSSKVFSETDKHVPLLPLRVKANISQVVSRTDPNTSQHQVLTRSDNSDIFPQINGQSPKLNIKTKTHTIQSPSHAHRDSLVLPKDFRHSTFKPFSQNPGHSHTNLGRSLIVNSPFSFGRDSSRDLPPRDLSYVPGTSNQNNGKDHLTRHKTTCSRVIKEIEEPIPPLPKRGIPCTLKFVPGTGKVPVPKIVKSKYIHTRNSSQQDANQQQLSTRSLSGQAKLNYITLDFTSNSEHEKPPRLPNRDNLKVKTTSYAGEKTPMLSPTLNVPSLPPRDYPNKNQKSSDKKQIKKNSEFFTKLKSKFHI